jgi:hypothetical protein
MSELLKTLAILFDDQSAPFCRERAEYGSFPGGTHPAQLDLNLRSDRITSILNVAKKKKSIEINISLAPITDIFALDS